MTFNFKKLSILVVEDQEAMCLLTCSLLNALGVGHISSATNGKEGFKLFQELNPDIVVADWLMEPMNGIELSHEIRTNMVSPNRLVPIILVTGYSAMHRIAEARDAGVTEILVKPFSANDISRRISNVIVQPRDFIEISTYFGPDRRRIDNPAYSGPFRRESDDGGNFLVG